jgi:hypothetical protein
MVWVGFLAISKSPELINSATPSPAVYKQAHGILALH